MTNMHVVSGLDVYVLMLVFTLIVQQAACRAALLEQQESSDNKEHERTAMDGTRIKQKEKEREGLGIGRAD